MWKDSTNNNIYAACAFGFGPYYLHVINMTTHTSAIVNSNAIASFNRHPFYSKTYNKLYFASEYDDTGSAGSYLEFNPVTMACTTIFTGLPNGAPSNQCLWNNMAITEGGDGLIYWMPKDGNFDGMRCFSYDPRAINRN